eukprot:6469187-Amphidinium_carterae.2
MVGMIIVQMWLQDLSRNQNWKTRPRVGDMLAFRPLCHKIIEAVPAPVPRACLSTKLVLSVLASLHTTDPIFAPGKDHTI